MDSSKPFVLRGGETEQASIHNRIAAIRRIQYLCGVDLTRKSKDYAFALDMEMYQRWYKHEPKDKKVDEEWCQRAAEVIKEMEKDPTSTDKATKLAEGAVSEAYKNYTASSPN